MRQCNDYDFFFNASMNSSLACFFFSLAVSYLYHILEFFWILTITGIWKVEKNLPQNQFDSMFVHSHGKPLHLNFAQMVCGCNNLLNLLLFVSIRLHNKISEPSVRVSDYLFVFQCTSSDSWTFFRTTRHAMRWYIIILDTQ